MIMQAVLEDTHNRTVRSCAWSPSGKLLATGSFDATTAIWENVGGDYECISTLEVESPLRCTFPSIRCNAHSSNLFMYDRCYLKHV